ncbi:MAG: AMP-dependent synthetase/ligase [Trueperella sp.]|uniref:AMP-dependent synthetase/ligase n=1 Tax=Trueperella sp. TaxID=2699835 RepID=UPI002A9165ED|nr:AMP-dependent synthetase/ligase [Trueperella sp.]MDY5404564.1 AMP-dependent synthetase/ligase [Trueperella sp.]
MVKKRRSGIVSGKRYVTPEPWMNIPWLLTRRQEAHPDQICIERQSTLGVWTPMTTTDYLADVNAVARGLVAEGLNEGDAIAIFAATSYEWSLVDMAALSAGLVVVPIYESDSAEQVRWILENSAIRFVVTDTHAQQALVESQRTPALGRVLAFDQDALVKLYAQGETIDQSEIDGRRSRLTLDTLATVIYTSGTTGRPKGVELTHGNFVDITLNTIPHMRQVIDTPETRVLLFLPLAHVMARSVFFFTIAGRGVVGHTPSIKNLISDLKTFKPSGLLVVPRVLEKIYNAAEAKAGSGLKRKIFRWAANVAVAYSERGRGPIRSLKHAVARKLVFSKITNIIGADCHYAVAAGAPLGKRTGHFFRGIGLTVLEAWGLTECTGAATVNLVDSIKMGTVGVPMPTTEIKIDDDGEILVRGPQIFRGYQNDPEATAEAFDSEGWFHTGDLGTLDRQGYLTITGRKKEIIVTAGGKNVSPAALEDPLSSHPLISQVIVVGDKKPFVGALITLDAEMLPGWLAAHDLPAMDVTQAARHPEVLASLERAIKKTNKRVSRAESIRKFTVIYPDLTVDNGMLTPSLKVKREAVARRYARELKALYGEG